MATTSPKPPTATAMHALAKEYKSMQDQLLEGFRVRLFDADNLFDWEVGIYGPPDTIYQGGYFRAHLHFPPDYPFSPPTMRFLTKVWHPNVHEYGDLCISILKPPTGSPISDELPCERWNPTQNVRTILLSVISLLNEPNTLSPANPDAAAMYRRWRDSKGKDNEYATLVRQQALATNAAAKREGIIVPQTLEDYCIKTKASTEEQQESDLNESFYYDSYEYEDIDEEMASEEEEAGKTATAEAKN